MRLTGAHGTGHQDNVGTVAAAEGAGQRHLTAVRGTAASRLFRFGRGHDGVDVIRRRGEVGRIQFIEVIIGVKEVVLDIKRLVMTVKKEMVLMLLVLMKVLIICRQDTRHCDALAAVVVVVVDDDPVVHQARDVGMPIRGEGRLPDIALQTQMSWLTQTVERKGLFPRQMALPNKGIMPCRDTFCCHM